MEKTAAFDRKKLYMAIYKDVCRYGGGEIRTLVLSELPVNIYMLSP